MEDVASENYLSQQRLEIQADKNCQSTSITMPTDRKEKEERRDRENYLSEPRYDNEIQKSLNNPLMNLKINASRR